MKLSKTLMSYLSAALLVLGVILTVIQSLTACTATATQTCPAPDPVLAKILLGLGVVTTAIRAVMTDFGGSSDPVVSAAATAGAAAGADAARKVQASS